MSILFRILAILLLLSSCADGRDTHATDKWFPDGACTMAGNDPSRHYCVTSAAQLLANPEIYDGRLIQVRGWVTSFDGHAFLYLSREMLDGADSYGSLAIVDGPQVEAIIRSVGTSSPENSGRSLLVGGRFFLNRKDAAGRSSLHDARYRFGALREVDAFRP
jgi:hypothetical protein